MRSLAAVLVLVLIWLAGLFAFADRARRAGPPDNVSAADGIVVLTGASDERIAAGLQLLEAGKGRRMLVSGVNEAVRREGATPLGRHESGLTAEPIDRPLHYLFIQPVLEDENHREHQDPDNPQPVQEEAVRQPHAVRGLPLRNR